MYGECGFVCFAHRVFDGMVKRDVASWTSMICGYCSMGKIEQAQILFERMKLEGWEPNDFTWNTIITGYARKGDSDGALALFSRMKREDLVLDLVTWNGMISGFVQAQRLGSVKDARNVFEKTPQDKNVASWNAMIGCYGKHGMMDSLIELFDRMQVEGIKADEVTLASVLSAFSHSGSVGT
ncbi:hypothetical protein GH714_001277 [Hevea brasiliensis]|uniref:Pentacotripeptide-repeat region of PRORP domain-containing protein n=1 Tax=Hevea brasiliensis TaxID=3981 RepID=A0A6A6MB74_HEVBR|nr:hypothetical protein GH714_001277 [Hevea brasiliensis]